MPSAYQAIAPPRSTILISYKILIDPLTITLNGDPFEIGAPLTVTELLARLDIDARRVAVEHNLVILKRAVFDQTVVQDGDQIEIVNFVGGG